MKYLLPIQQIAKSLLAGTIIFCQSACTTEKLTVFSTYITQNNLASFHVGTPDPCLNNPSAGQRLYIGWRLPNDYLDKKPLELKLHLWFHNGHRTIEIHSITQLSGTHVYELLNNDFFDTEGLFAYKIELFGKGELLDEWRHLMWVELINFEDNSKD